MKDKFLIGELAKMFDVSTDTLRHYDKLDLLKPQIDPDNKYRYYDVRSMFKLSRIIFLKNLGIALCDISAYMTRKNTDALKTILSDKHRDIDLEIQHLINLKHKIASKLQLFEHANTKLGKISVTSLDQRRGIYLKTFGLEHASQVKEMFKGSENFLKMSSWLVEGEVFTSISQADMCRGVFHEFRYFIEVESTDNKTNDQLVILPRSLHACLTYIGPYEDLHNHYRTLIAWIKAHGYTIIGDSIEHNIVDNDYSDSKDEFITEIQIPIQ